MKKRLKNPTLASRRRQQRSSHSLNFEPLEDRRCMAAATLVPVAFDMAAPSSQHFSQNISESIDVNAPTARIVNGTQTNQFESVGLLGDRRGFHCTGTLIGSRYVLTAAHCAEGIGNTAGRFEIGGQTYSTTRVVVHPQYNSRTLANDLAIFVLDRDVTGVDPTAIFRGAPQVGQQLTLVGFGAGGNGNSGHNGDFGIKRVGTTPIDRVTSTLISWRFDNNSESNTAPGDSGGPAFVTVNGTLYLAGVTSGGDRANAGIGDNSFDTRVDAFQNWIDSVTGSTGGGGGGENTGDDGNSDEGSSDEGSSDEGGGNTGNGGESEDDHTNNIGATATTIPLNSNGTGSASGNLEIAGDRDVFKIQVSDPGTATIRATGLDGLDTYLRVYDVNGNLVAQNDDAGGTYNSLVNLDVSAGTYYISVGSYADRGIGRFSVSLDVATDENGGDESDGDATDDAGNVFVDANNVPLNSSGNANAYGVIETGDDIDMFRFTANQSGAMVVRALRINGNLDTTLTVYDANGQQILFNDDSGWSLNSRVRFNTVAGQTYYFKVASYGSTTGDYRLRFRSIASRAGVPANLLSNSERQQANSFSRQSADHRDRFSPSATLSLTGQAEEGISNSTHPEHFLARDAFFSGCETEFDVE